MKRYRVKITGLDSIGWSFLQNVIKVAGQGGVIAHGINPRLSFPHELMMILDTDKEMESVVGITYTPILTTYTEKELAEMEWDTFRAELKKVGVIGKDRQKMVDKYLDTIKGM